MTTNRSQLTHFLVQMPETHGKKEIYSQATLSPLGDLASDTSGSTFRRVDMY